MNKESKDKFQVGDLVYFIYHPSDRGVSTGVILETKDFCPNMRKYIIKPSKRVTASPVVSFYEEELYKTLEEVTIIHGQDGKEEITRLRRQIDRAVNTLAVIYSIGVEEEIFRIRKELTQLGNQDE